jgi:hypothetical protein
MATVRSRLYTPIDPKAHETLFAGGIFVNLKCGGEEPVYQLVNEGKQSKLRKRQKVKLILVDTQFQKKMECVMTVRENTHERVRYEGEGVDPVDGKKYHYTLRLRVDLTEDLKKIGMVGSGILQLRNGFIGYTVKDDVDAFTDDEVRPKVIN